MNDFEIVNMPSGGNVVSRFGGNFVFALQNEWQRGNDTVLEFE
jgi:predicted SpoU family rRNA methylase